MDFAPEPSTASYERYVSESDTDGEGDASGGGLHRSSASSTLPYVTNGGKEKGISSTGGVEVGASGVDRRGGSMFTRLAASWRGSSTKKKRGSGETRGGNGHHSYGGGPSGHKEDGGGGGTLWKDIREGSPREGREGLSSGDRCVDVFDRYVLLPFAAMFLCWYVVASCLFVLRRCLRYHSQTSLVAHAVCSFGRWSH